MKSHPHILPVPSAVPLLLFAASFFFFASQPVGAQRMPQDSWYLAKEFSAGGTGKFSSPYDVAVGPDGNLYVADYSNQQIQVLDADGLFLRAWTGSSAGVPNGSFYPRSIAVGADGKVYVADQPYHRALVFDAQGKFVRSMGQQGSSEGQLNGPTAIAVDASGNVYVGDQSNYRVTVFDSSGDYVRSWGGYGWNTDGKFSGINEIMMLSGNTLAVSDGSRIQIFSSDGTFISKISTNWADGSTVDSAGNYYLSRSGGKIQKLSSSGSLIQEFDLSSKIGSQTCGLAVAGDKLYLADYSNNRINIVDTAGNFIAARGSQGSVNSASTYGIAVDAQGNTFLADFDMGEIRKYDSNYQLLKKFGTPGSGDGQFNGVCALAIGANQKLYALDQNSNRVQIFDLEGNFIGKFGAPGSGNGQLNVPSGLAVGKDNKVYVADRDNHRVQIFDANGVFIAKFGKEGAFDGEFKSPRSVATFPNGDLAVADYGNKRIQIFDQNGNFLRKQSYFTLAQASISGLQDESNYNSPEFVFATGDGLLVTSGNSRAYTSEWRDNKSFYTYNYGYPLVVADSLLSGLKGWWAGDPIVSNSVYTWGAYIYKYTTRCAGPVAETNSGDLLAAHGDRMVRVWKRTFRTVHPEPGNALPLPSIVSQSRRPGTSLLDVEYLVKDADNATVQTAALAFKDGGNSLADVIPISTLADGTASKLGSSIATGQVQRFTWDVASDWDTDFGEVQLEILANDGRGLLNLDFLQIPATGNQTALKISRSPLNDNDFLSVWYWLIATGDSGIRFADGQISTADGSTGNVDGLFAEYFENGNFTGTKFTRIDQVPNSPTYNSTDQIAGIPFLARSIRWSGNFVPAVTGNYSFYAGVSGQAKISIDGNNKLENNNGGFFTVSAQAGVAIPMTVEIKTGAQSWDSNYRYIYLYVTPPNEGQRGVSGSDFQNAQDWLAFGGSTTRLGRQFLFQRMGLREATAAEVLRAKEAGTSGVVNQWEPKLKVGPDERPAKINAYGFDTGGSGYWVVPVSSN
jgi:sugar lactone lactonase YvrE